MSWINCLDCQHCSDKPVDERMYCDDDGEILKTLDKCNRFKLEEDSEKRVNRLRYMKRYTY